MGSAFTAASLTTNTNWELCAEVTMSYLTQMAGLAYHNFASASVGIVLAIAFIRGIARAKCKLSNFWVDLVLYVAAGCVLGAYCWFPGGDSKVRPNSKAVEPQTIEVDKKDANGIVLTNPDGTNQKETKAITEQTIAQGPVASQEFIKELGTNGGGFFNVNSAHPFENPTPFSNFIELLAIFALGGGLTYTLGRMTGSPKHGWAVLAAMVVLFSPVS